MHGSVLISLPKKETIEVNWSYPLSKYITQLYGTSEEFKEEITTIQRLRQDMRGCALDTTGRDIMYRYYGQLELLDLRIPVSESGCKMSFTWSDALDHSSSTQTSLAFEKAAILFNLAAAYSKIGVDTDDVKVAYAAFQNSAGIFAFILENFLHAPSTDLAQNTVKALSTLMLAQAQELFVQKFMDDTNSKPSMIAKLAKGASNIYKTSAENLQEIETTKSWGERSWLLLVQLKQKYFLAISSEYQAHHLEANGKYGEALATVQNALELMTQCSKMPLISPYTEMGTISKDRLESLKHQVSSMEKDNDFIYHALVPPYNTLPDVNGMEAAKPTPMNALYKNVDDVSKIIGRDIFEKLIPLSVHEKSSMYSEEKAKLLRNEGEKAEIADEELSSALEFLDLPTSLHLLKNPESVRTDDAEIPSIVKDWASELSSSHNVSLDSLENERQVIYNNLKTAENLLAKEEAEWNDLKMKYGTGWSQTTPASLTSSMRSDIARVKESLALGANSDKKVKDVLLPISNELNALRSGPNGYPLKKLYTFSDGPILKQEAPSLLDLDSGEEEQLNEKFDKAELLLTKLRKLSQERKAVLAEMKDKVHKDDISSLLILNKKVPNIEEKLFKSELEKFQPYQARIEATIHHQGVTLKELTAVWKSVLTNDAIRRKTARSEDLKSQRISVTEGLRSAYNSWKEVGDGLIKGQEFYTSLSSMATSILNNASQYSSNRAEERESILKSLSSSSQHQSDDDLRRQLSQLSMSRSSSTFGGSQPALPAKPGLPSKQGSYQMHPGEYKPYSQPSAYDPSFYGPPSQPPPPTSSQPQAQGYRQPFYSYQQQQPQQPHQPHQPQQSQQPQQQPPHGQQEQQPSAQGYGWNGRYQ